MNIGLKANFLLIQAPHKVRRLWAHRPLTAGHQMGQATAPNALARHAQAVLSPLLEPCGAALVFLPTQVRGNSPHALTHFAQGRGARVYLACSHALRSAGSMACSLWHFPTHAGRKEMQKAAPQLSAIFLLGAFGPQFGVIHAMSRIEVMPLHSATCLRVGLRFAPVLLATLCWGIGHVQAQVLECTHANGRITLTNLPCPAGQRARQIPLLIGQITPAPQTAYQAPPTQQRPSPSFAPAYHGVCDGMRCYDAKGSRLLRP